MKQRSAVKSFTYFTFVIKPAACRVIKPAERLSLCEALEILSTVICCQLHNYITNWFRFRSEASMKSMSKPLEMCWLECPRGTLSILNAQSVRSARRYVSEYLENIRKFYCKFDWDYVGLHFMEAYDDWSTRKARRKGWKIAKETLMTFTCTSSSSFGCILSTSSYKISSWFLLELLRFLFDKLESTRK